MLTKEKEIEDATNWNRTEFCMLNNKQKSKEFVNYQNKLLELTAKIKDA